MVNPEKNERRILDAFIGMNFSQQSRILQQNPKLVYKKIAREPDLKDETYILIYETFKRSNILDDLLRNTNLSSKVLEHILENNIADMVVLSDVAAHPNSDSTILQKILELNKNNYNETLSFNVYQSVLNNPNSSKENKETIVNYCSIPRILNRILSDMTVSFETALKAYKKLEYTDLERAKKLGRINATENYQRKREILERLDTPAEFLDSSKTEENFLIQACIIMHKNVSEDTLRYIMLNNIFHRTFMLAAKMLQTRKPFLIDVPDEWLEEIVHNLRKENGGE